MIEHDGTKGPNGPIPEEILQLHPNATIVRRSGEVNAWDSEEFRAAVRATGKKQVILAGITTDVRFICFNLIFGDRRDSTSV